MRKVIMHYLDVMSQIQVTFEEEDRSVGRTYAFLDDNRVLEIAKRGRVVLEDVNLIERNLVNRRPGRVELRLTDEQHDALVRPKFKPKVNR